MNVLVLVVVRVLAALQAARLRAVAQAVRLQIVAQAALLPVVRLPVVHRVLGLLQLNSMAGCMCAAVFCAMKMTKKCSYAV